MPRVARPTRYLVYLYDVATFHPRSAGLDSLDARPASLTPPFTRSDAMREEMAGVLREMRACYGPSFAFGVTPSSRVPLTAGEIVEIFAEAIATVPTERPFVFARSTRRELTSVDASVLDAAGELKGTTCQAFDVLGRRRLNRFVPPTRH